MENVATRAQAGREAARARVQGVLSRAGETVTREQMVAAIAEHAPITLSFHPDRLLDSGITVVEGLLSAGRYKSQFETGISNGSRTAFPGGDRDRWEQRLFGDAYHDGDVAAGARPKYGALNILGHPDGASPRFGSCYFELRPHMTARATLTWGDSHEGPEHVGTLDAFDSILAAMLTAAEETGDVFGVTGMDASALMTLLSSAHRLPRSSAGRALDAYIEAQVHAEIDLAGDVAALVIDPSFERTATGVLLRELASKNGIALRVHPGFVLAAKDVPDDFRGPRMVPLAARIDAEFGASSGEIDAALLGVAAATVSRSPERWSDWGTVDETLQHIKQLWHCLVRFGRPHRAQQ